MVRVFQKFGKALMVPVALLPAAGVIKVKNNIQAIFGGRSDLYKNELLKMHREMDQAN